MKLIRSLFQTVTTGAMVIALSQPIFAESYIDNIQVDRSVSTTGHMTHLSASTILTGLGSGFVDGIITLVTMVVIGLAIWLVMPPAAPMQADTGEQPLVEVPPLRPSPYRVTKF
jgi:hypothetical protein